MKRLQQLNKNHKIIITMETKYLSTTQVAAINEIAKRINESINPQFDNCKVVTIFSEVINLKKGLSDDNQKKEVTKYFFSLFDNLTIARIKVATKVGGDKVTRTTETNKGIDNILSKPVEEQKKGVRSMLRNFVARNKGNKHNLHFSQTQYLTTFDNLTDEEFRGLYRGATTIKVETVVSFVTGKLIEEENEQKGVK